MENNIKNEKQMKSKRRWKSDNLPRVFTVRAKDDEYKKLKKMADETDHSLSRLLIEATLYLGVRPAAEVRADREVFEELIFQVRRVGINLNQIVHRLNAARRGKAVPPLQSELESVIKEVERTVETLKLRL
jgi:hypothetical protein